MTSEDVKSSDRAGMRSRYARISSRLNFASAGSARNSASTSRTASWLRSVLSTVFAIPTQCNPQGALSNCHLLSSGPHLT